MHSVGRASSSKQLVLGTRAEIDGLRPSRPAFNIQLQEAGSAPSQGARGKDRDSRRSRTAGHGSIAFREPTATAS